jgi:DNA-binding SARP family transcriptional activator
MLRIAVLGPFALRDEFDRLLPRLPAKAVALIAWLVFAGHDGVPRRRIAEVLWGGDGIDPAGALRQCLHKLRRDGPAELGAAVFADAERVSIIAASAVADLWAFQRYADEGVGAGFARAALLWRGDVLEGAPSLGDAFDRLLEMERMRLRAVATSVLQRLSVRARSPGEFEAAIALGQRLIVADPLCEESCRALMGLLGRIGRRGDAERVFELCRRALAADLGVVPAHATVSLRDAIRVGTPPP